jgi:hypothetical protein
MDDVHAAHTVSARGAGDVVEVERGDGRGDDAAVAVDDRMMDEREKDFSQGVGQMG